MKRINNFNKRVLICASAYLGAFFSGQLEAGKEKQEDIKETLLIKDLESESAKKIYENLYNNFCDNKQLQNRIRGKLVTSREIDQCFSDTISGILEEIIQAKRKETEQQQIVQQENILDYNFFATLIVKNGIGDILKNLDTVFIYGDINGKSERRVEKKRLIASKAKVVINDQLAQSYSSFYEKIFDKKLYEKYKQSSRIAKTNVQRARDKAKKKKKSKKGKKKKKKKVSTMSKKKEEIVLLWGPVLNFFQ